jgi:hypothetical protein
VLASNFGSLQLHSTEIRVYPWPLVVTSHKPSVVNVGDDDMHSRYPTEAKAMWSKPCCQTEPTGGGGCSV